MADCKIFLFVWFSYVTLPDKSDCVSVYYAPFFPTRDLVCFFIFFLPNPLSIVVPNTSMHCAYFIGNFYLGLLLPIWEGSDMYGINICTDYLKISGKKFSHYSMRRVHVDSINFNTLSCFEFLLAYVNFIVFVYTFSRSHLPCRPRTLRLCT